MQRNEPGLRVFRFPSVMLLAAAALAGCGKPGAGVDPRTRRLDQLSRTLAQGSMIERRRAARALGALNDPLAVGPLAAALADTSPAVRMTAAEALVTYGQKAWGPLTAALGAKEPAAREAGAYGLGKLADPRAAELLRKAMADEAPEVRAAAIEALGSLGDGPSCPALIAELDAPDERVRQAAVNALARIAGPAAAEKLVAILADRKSKAGASAKATLVKMGAAAVPAVAAAIRDPDRNVQAQAVELLSRIGGKPAADALAAALADKGVDSQGHDRIVSTLIDLGADDLADALLPMLGSPNRRAQSLAARYLAGQGDKRAVPALLEAFRETPDSGEVIGALASLGDPRAGAALLEAYKDPANKARAAIAEALGKLGYGPAGPLVAQELRSRWARRDDKSEHRMITSLCEAAGRLRCAEAVDLLIEATAYERDSYAGLFLRAAAARALGQIGDKKAIPALAACSQDGENRPQAAACEALGMLRDPASVPPLIEAMKDRSRDVRGAAAAALVELGPLALKPLLDRIGEKDLSQRSAVVTVLARMQPPPIKELLAGLRSADPAERQGAVWALGMVKDRQAFDPLTAALKDKDPEVRGAAVWALREVNDPRAASPLIDALGDESFRVRSEAAGALAALGDRQAVAPILRLLSDADGEARRSAAAALGELRDARAVGPLGELVRRETAGLDKLLDDLKKQGKLTADGRMVRGKPMSDDDKRAILTHRNVRSAATLALDKIGRAATTQAATAPQQEPGDD